MYNLFLDDCKMPKDVFLYTKNPMYMNLDWDIVMNYNEFIKIIEEKGIPNVISFDYDLADEHYNNNEHPIYDQFTEKTGYHCARWLINYCIDHAKDVPKMVLIHTMNPVGSQNIASLFETYDKIYRGT
jgi:hypothetical protein